MNNLYELKNDPSDSGILCGRKLKLFSHESGEEFGYKKPQTDTFALIFPKDYDDKKAYPLTVVFHSAGHDVYTAFSITWQDGNHDIYKTPDDSFGLYLDCRRNMNDWWWGGNIWNEVLSEGRDSTELQPVEKRCMATAEWVCRNYPVDTDRIYAVGNSMGGSGALGMAMNRGDFFAGVKVNVPAGVRHMMARCGMNGNAPEGFKIPDPPVLVDYSSQCDVWSTGHDKFYPAMNEMKYQVFGFFGMFGHENNDHVIYEHNDLVHSFDIFSVKRSDPYPVFTNASTNDAIPFGEEGKVLNENSGQINGYFRWGDFEQTEKKATVTLRLLKQDEWESRVKFPTESVADVTLRRLSTFGILPGERLKVTYDGKVSEITADMTGHVTVKGLHISSEPKELTVEKI